VQPHRQQYRREQDAGAQQARTRRIFSSRQYESEREDGAQHQQPVGKKQLPKRWVEAMSHLKMSILQPPLRRE